MIADLAVIALISVAVFSLLYTQISREFCSSELITLIIFSLLTFALSVLIYSHIQDDFSLTNVYLNSHTNKPLIYKISAVWGNHEGSMLLWIWMLYLYGALLEFFLAEQRLKTVVLSLQYFLGFGFIFFCLLLSNPFEKMPFLPSNGLGFNPLLQDIGLLIHPPILYFGYVGSSAIFTISLGALILNMDCREWANTLKPWVILSWTGLTLGIGLGSWWAYRELGWGGFWFWDPVENVSLIPWLLSTALFHLLFVMKKIDVLRNFALLIALSTFLCSLIGTFLVRSGILTSVHSFANNPQHGLYFLTFFVVIKLFALLVCILFPFRQTKNIFMPQFASVEMMILIGCILLVTAFSIVSLGTIYPIILEYFTGQVISIGAPYYNSLFNCIALLLLLAMIMASHLRYHNLNSFIKKNGYAIIGPLALLPFIISLNPLTMCAILISTFSICTTLNSYIKNLCGFTTTFKNKSYQSMSLAHLGIAIIAFGISYSSGFQKEKEQYMRIGDAVVIDKFKITLNDISFASTANYQTLKGHFKIQKINNKIVKTIVPENRRYLVEGTKSIESAIYHYLWFWDLYIVIGDFNENKMIAVKIYYKPGINAIWLGVILVTLGGMLAIDFKKNKTFCKIEKYI